MTRLALVTSLNPHEAAAQAAGLATFADAGFAIHAVNFADEIAALADVVGPDITLVTAPDAPEIGGRRLMPLDSLLAHLRRVDADRVGIVNADIRLHDRDRLDRALDCPADLMVGNRLDIKPDGAIEIYRNGFDLFVMTPGQAAALPASQFHMGLPWWDYWLPVVAALAGRDVRRIDPPVITHHWHENRWAPESYFELGIHFLAQMEQAPDPAPGTGFRGHLGNTFLRYTFNGMLGLLGDRNNPPPSWARPATNALVDCLNASTLLALQDLPAV